MPQLRPCVQRRKGSGTDPRRMQLLQRMDEPAQEPARDLPRMGRQGLRHQVCFQRKPRLNRELTYGLVSYYLSSHHIDIHCWIMQGNAVPTRVMASAATGIATSEPFNCVPQTEDTITLLVDWQSLKSSKHRSTAVYTASWTAPLKAGIHTAQHWYYMAEKVRPASSAPRPSRRLMGLAFHTGRDQRRPGAPRV